MKNKHIEDTLTSYLSKPPFGALLVTGDWGCGKTHYVKESKAFRTNSTAIISIYGTSNLKQIQEKIVYSAYPLLGDKTAKALGSLARSALGVFRFDINLEMSDLFEIDGIQAIVVDDLERTNCDIEEVLGYFNGLVEHEKKHVILIGDYSYLEKKGNFSEIREKTIGKVVSIYPDFQSTIASISSEVSGEYSGFLLDAVDEIEDTFQRIQSKNLRVLKQIIFEFEEIFEHINSLDWISKTQKQKIFRQFQIFAIAWKTGSLKRNEFAQRSEFQYAGIFEKDDAKPVNSVVKLANLFSRDEIFTLYLDNEYFVRKICDGLSDIELLDRGLNDIRETTDPERHPEWRILWHYLDHDRETIQTAYNRLRIRFANREYLDAGVIVHVFGIMIEMHKAKLDRRALDKIIRESKRYVDDLYKAGDLPALSDDLRDSLKYGSAHGLGFMNFGDESFRVIFQYLERQSKLLSDEGRVENLKMLINNLEGNEEIFQAVITDYSEKFSVASGPFLTQVQSKKLAQAVMKCSGKTQANLIRAIGQRYYNFSQLVDQEGSWLTSFTNQLRRIAEALPAPNAYRIDRLIELSLSEPLSRFAATQR
ncbi:hypothetical protein [Parasphingorhabdus sp. NYA22]